MSYLGTNKIGKMYLGSTSIGKAYLGSNLVFQQGGAQPVIIPYIRGGADGSYIDTGIVPDSTTSVIVWARNFNPNSGFIFGSRVAFRNQAFALNANIGTQSGRITVNYGDVVNNTSSGDHFRYLSGYHKYEMQPISISVDDTQLFTGSGTFSGNSLNLHLFGINNGGTHTSTSSPVDICACQIYKNNVLVRDYTAVNTPSVGFYDAVSQTLFTNAGSGSFIYGEFDKNAYIPLEYISSTKEQYIDTGILATGGMTCVAKFMITNTEKQYKRLFGVRDAGNTNMFELMVGNTTTSNRYFAVRYNDSYKTIDAKASQNSVPLVYGANGNSSSLYKNNAALGSTVSFDAATFTSNKTIFIASSSSVGIHDSTYGFYGRIYYIGFGARGNFVPAQKGSRIGMYDTYNDVFYPSATNTPFIAGPTI